MENDFIDISEQTKMTMLELVDSIITRICHDLINPVGTAQIALEQLKEYPDAKTEMENTIASCLEQGTEKLDLFRTIFKINKQGDDVALELLYKYIKKHNLQIEIFDTNLRPALLFFLTQKMMKKSRIEFHSDKIVLENIRLNEEEIQALEGTICEINAGNILPFIAQLMHGKAKIIAQTDPLNWQIII